MKQIQSHLKAMRLHQLSNFTEQHGAATHTVHPARHHQAQPSRLMHAGHKQHPQQWGSPQPDEAGGPRGDFRGHAAPAAGPGTPPHQTRHPGCLCGARAAEPAPGAVHVARGRCLQVRNRGIVQFPCTNSVHADNQWLRQVASGSLVLWMLPMGNAFR